MTNQKSAFLFAAIAVLSFSACQKAETADDRSETKSTPAHPSDPIESAMAAAPATIAKGAKVMSVKADGTMNVLREGSNGWTCMPDNPATPGADPMCADANAMKWVEAWIGRKPPPPDNVGLVYMLAGGSDASNTDPYGQMPKEGGKWVETGPHVMVVGSDSLNQQYPPSENPDTSQPYVMFAGTPYAHMMIPVN